jgi:hypothetical protein
VSTEKTDLLPVIVSPLNDPSGLLFEHIQAITPDLKQLYELVYLSISPATEMEQPENVRWFQDEPFFEINLNIPDSLPGDHYLAGYHAAVKQNSANQILHLCDLDRVAFVLNTDHRQPFISDIQWASKRAQQQPLLFQRSQRAWDTYPENYHQIEHMIIRVGEMLFQEYYDFAWSYMVMRSGQLAEILPRIRSHDFGILIEIVLTLRESLKRKSVDWLSWEDPYIFGRDPDELRQERNSSRAETYKRLRGLLPFFEHFLSVTAPLSTELGWEKSVESEKG